MGCVLSGSPASGFVRRLSRKDPRFERRREDRLRQLPQFPGVSRRTLRQWADLLLRDGFESVDVELRFRRRYLLQPDLSRFVRADPGRLHVDLQQPRPQSLHGYGQRQRFALARRTVASGVAQYPPLQRGARKLRSGWSTPPTRSGSCCWDRSISSGRGTISKWPGSGAESLT